MKKILLSIIGLAMASPAWSAQTAVTEISGIQPSVGALKTQVNTKLGTVESNRQDHETRVAAMESGKETKAVVQASAPADTTVDWYDTDQESGVLVLKRHNGTTWVRASSHGVQYASNCAGITAGMCVDTDDGKLYYHNNTSVVEVGTGAGSGISHAPADGNYYASKDNAWASLSGVFAAPLSSDDNYVTDAEKTKLSNLSGTNTGDQDITGKADISCFADSVSFNACFALDWPTGGSQTASTTPFTPSGSIEATTVQAAIQEVRDEAASGSLPAWMPTVGPANSRQILQATGGCTLSAYDNQADCETNSGTWTTPTYQHTSIISGLINDTGTADDDLWSAAKITSELAGKQATLGFTPENTANKGAANGYAGLGSDGKVPSSQLPTLGTTYELPSLADAQAGTSATPYVWSPQRVAQAIAALSSGSGSVSSTIEAPYSDVACTAPKYDTVANRYYLCVDGYYTAYLSGVEFSNPSAQLFDLTVDGTGWDGTDAITVSGSTYTADGVKTGLSGSVSAVVTPNSGRVASCSGVGVSGSGSPYTIDMSTDRTLSCTFSSTGYTDNFNQANENPLSSGGVWINPGGSYYVLKVESNAVTSMSGNGIAYYATASHTFTANQYSQVKVTTNDNSFAGPVARFNPGTSYYYQAGIYYGAAKISRVRVDGNSTSWEVAAGQSIAGKVLKLAVTGSSPVTLKLYIDGVQIGSDVVDSSAYAIQSGQPGIGTTGTGVIDDWAGGEL